MSLFSFPDDARWDEATRTVEFSVAIGEYRGVVRVPRQVFQSLLDTAVTPQSCITAFYMHRSEFERAAEIKLRARDLTKDGNVELTLRDLRVPTQTRSAEARNQGQSPSRG
ncbi:MAG TPA: DUF1488 family protein [Stellaceae bacterium]|nr:DUF1488 family protein [Stellaceae bacterium]